MTSFFSDLWLRFEYLEFTTTFVSLTIYTPLVILIAGILRYRKVFGFQSKKK